MFIRVNLATPNNPNVYKWSFACNNKAKSNGKFHRRVVATPLLLQARLPTKNTQTTIDKYHLLYHKKFCLSLAKQGEI